MSAYNDLMRFLEEGETVEGIVFGAWGWGSLPRKGEEWARGHDEPVPPPVPLELRTVLLSLERARPYMEGWKFYGGYGAPACYATYIWTNYRVIWVTQYDGSTSLDSAPRDPTAGIVPEMPGG